MRNPRNASPGKVAMNFMSEMECPRKPHWQHAKVRINTSRGNIDEFLKFCRDVA
jgi:hypothetical protein